MNIDDMKRWLRRRCMSDRQADSRLPSSPCEWIIAIVVPVAMGYLLVLAKMIMNH